jgi:hypothetical protein
MISEGVDCGLRKPERRSDFGSRISHIGKMDKQEFLKRTNALRFARDSCS